MSNGPENGGSSGGSGHDPLDVEGGFISRGGDLVGSNDAGGGRGETHVSEEVLEISGRVILGSELSNRLSLLSILIMKII